MQGNEIPAGCHEKDLILDFVWRCCAVDTVLDFGEIRSFPFRFPPFPHPLSPFLGVFGVGLVDWELGDVG